MTTADEAAVASAAAAAVAAVASWATVLQASRIQRRALEPRLHIQAAYEMESSAVRIRVENTGGGFASQVYFWVREGDEVVSSGLPPHGSLGPGRGVTLRAVMTRRPGLRMAEALVIWRYGTRIFVQCGAPSRRKSWSLHKWVFWRPQSNDAIVRRFFPESPTLTNLRLLRSDLVSED